MSWIYDILDAIPALWRLVEIKTEAMFLRQLRAYCLQLFRGELGEFAWIDDMSTTIADQMGKAWREGARAVEVEPSEFTDEDNEELDKIIASEYEYVLALGSDILALRLMGGMLEEYRTKFAGRIEVWAHRYTDVVNQAKVWFGKRKKVKLKWEMGATEEHCATCAALNGIVAYAEDWERSGIHPQNPPNQALECGGWRCDCSLVPTKERATNNAFDEIVDRVTAAKDGEKSLKYDPNQPRVPAGNSEGGQWTDGAGNISRIIADEESIRNAETEYSFSYDKDGKMVLFNGGSKTEIYYTEEEVALFRGGTLTHNHPDGYSLSEFDLRLAYQLQLKEIRAVTTTATYIVKTGINGWPDENTIKNLYSTARVTLIEYITENNITDYDGIRVSSIIVSSISQTTGLIYEVIQHD
jgi:hypothetical protein